MQEIINKTDNQPQEEPKNKPVNDEIELRRFVADIRPPYT